MSTIIPRLAAVALAVGLALPRQAAGQDSRLERRLDPGTRALVTTIVDSARAAGLPVEPLVDKALEGASKRASTERIVAAVRRLAAELGAARAALGFASTDAELDAGASALHAGVRPRDLVRIRDTRPNQVLTVPLAVLSDLVARGIPADTAAAFVLELAGTARDAEFVAFRHELDRDIALGAPPVAAAAIRVNRTLHDQALTGSLPPATPPPRKP